METVQPGLWKMSAHKLGMQQQETSWIDFSRSESGAERWSDSE